MYKSLLKIILLFVLYAIINVSAQPTVVNAVHYTQISSFETDFSIYALKMSFDGSKIVFATGGAEVKVFTIDTDGTSTEATRAFGPMTEIAPPRWKAQCSVLHYQK